jgi:carboxymethylenebutenolidase
MKRTISIKTADGICPVSLFGSGRSGVIVYMDAFGPRPAMDEMAERVAGLGYTVIVPDLFYRAGPYGPFDAKTAFANEQSGSAIRKMMGDTTQAMTQADTAHFIKALDDAGATGPVGTVGYCMGGARAMNAAAKYPDRIKAAASFHGGNLASDAADSPHRQCATIKGRVYVGVAGVDKSFPPEQSARLAEALRTAEIDHTIENYVGKLHGWTVPDHSVFDAEGAARHWTRLATLFSETLTN